MDLTGKILEIQDEQQISAKFRKRSMILETTEDQFPQTFEIEFTQDRGQLLEKWRVGQQVIISINLKGRKWTSPKNEVRYFSSINGWRIQPSDENTTVSGGYKPGPASSNDEDDIPF